MKRSLAIAALLVAGFALYSLDHGLYKNCRYLFVTGITEAPALGGLGDLNSVLHGVRSAAQRDDLYCRLFRD